jgi:ABC-type amino acid transport substrate-binding protein
MGHTSREKTGSTTSCRRGRRVRRMLGLAVAVGLAVSPGLVAADDPVQLRLGSDEWPPFTDDPGGQRAAVELVHTALERAGIDATTIIVDWKDVEAGIRHGTFDGSAAMWKTDRREQDLLFSAPYLENRLVLVGRKGSDVSATRMSDLAGKRVAAVGRYAYGEEIDEATGVLFVNARNDQDSLDKLLAGEVEYMLVDELVAHYLVTYQAEEAMANLEIGTTPLARRMLHFAIRKDVPGAQEIVSAFDIEMRRMLSDGTYGRILQVGWIRVDVDGDGLDEIVALGEYVGDMPPGRVYDVFGSAPEDLPPEKQRIVVQGNVYEGWDAIPEELKMQGPAGPNDVTYKQGTTLMTFKF